MGKITLTEGDLHGMIKAAVYRLLNEGITYKSNGDGSINATINSLQTDKDNAEVDTRIWGRKRDVLNGDGTLGKRSKSISQKVGEMEIAQQLYLKIIGLLEKGATSLDPKMLDAMPNGQSKTAFIRRFKAFNSGQVDDDEEMTPQESMLNWAKKMYEKNKVDMDINTRKMDRFSSLGDEEKGLRYDTGLVPDTNVEFISLYRMNDFNFSDVGKHGEFRQNGLTDKLLGISKDQRSREDKLIGKGQAALKRIPATYDNGLTPDVQNNFSLTNDLMSPGSEHYKKQYGYGSDEYTSFTQFMDKSIIYASRVLNEIGYHPDVIIAPPSSSKYNTYYCTNLSRKLGVPYIKDFFERNVVDVKCDETGMRNAGMSESNIMLFKNKVRQKVTSEISLIIAAPIVRLVNTHADMFSMVRKGRGVNYDLSAIRTVVCQMSANALVRNMGARNTDYLYKQICFKLANPEFGGKTIKDPKIEKAINDIVHSRVIMTEYQSALSEMHNLILRYEEMLMNEGGIKLNVASKKFKITDFDKRERKFLSNVYVVASKNLNQNGELFNRLANSNFLIFDEDMNSGATLKLSIDALLDKLPGHDENQIKCLVNCYSSGGK